MATPYCDFTHFQYSFSAGGACQKFKKWRGACAESVLKICVSAFFLQKARAETRNDGAGQKYTFTQKTNRKLKLKRIFDLTSYFPQKRTLWPGQSLSSPIRRRFFDPPNGAIRWMHQYVCIRLNTSAYVCLVNSPSRSVHLFNLSHSVHLLHLPHSIPVNCQKMVRNAYLF